MKTCTKCLLEKEESEFNKRKAGKDGLNSWCKLCVKKDNESRKGKYTERNREYRLKYINKPEVKERIKRNYQENKDKIRERLKVYYWALSSQINQYKKSARKRNLEFSLSKDECQLYFDSTCNYCGDKFRGLGIDRVNNKLGYIPSNCVPCCTICNTMKMQLSLLDFKNHIIKIYNNDIQ